jgi:hypothetical protein
VALPAFTPLILADFFDDFVIFATFFDLETHLTFAFFATFFNFKVTVFPTLTFTWLLLNFGDFAASILDGASNDSTIPKLSVKTPIIFFFFELQLHEFIQNSSYFHIN